LKKTTKSSHEGKKSKIFNVSPVVSKDRKSLNVAKWVRWRMWTPDARKVSAAKFENDL